MTNVIAIDDVIVFDTIEIMIDDVIIFDTIEIMIDDVIVFDMIEVMIDDVIVFDMIDVMTCLRDRFRFLSNFDVAIDIDVIKLMCSYCSTKVVNSIKTKNDFHLSNFDS